MTGSFWKLKYPGRPYVPSFTMYNPNECPHEEVNLITPGVIKCWACNSVVIDRETKTQSVFIHESDYPGGLCTPTK